MGSRRRNNSWQLNRWDAIVRNRNRRKGAKWRAEMEGGDGCGGTLESVMDTYAPSPVLAASNDTFTVLADMLKEHRKEMREAKKNKNDREVKLMRLHNEKESNKKYWAAIAENQRLEWARLKKLEPLLVPPKMPELELRASKIDIFSPPQPPPPCSQPRPPQPSFTPDAMGDFDAGTDTKDLYAEMNRKLMDNMIRLQKSFLIDNGNNASCSNDIKKETKMEMESNDIKKETKMEME